MVRLTPRSANITAAVITVVGCLQMIGYAMGSRSLRGLGAMTAIAPYPKVFSDVDGLETFACDFTLHWKDGGDRDQVLPITPELYSRLKGAYNRRNVYGAALSYAPRLPEPLWRAVFGYAFGPNGPLRRDFGLPAEAHDFAVEIRTTTQGRHDRWLLRPAAPK